MEFLKTILFLLFFVSIAYSINPEDSAICPPTAWISCGKNPPNPLVCQTASSYCCWVNSPNSSAAFYETPTSHWVSSDFHTNHEYTPYSLGIERNFDPDSVDPVLEITYDWTTRILTEITCNYVQQNFCSGGGQNYENPRILFSLKSTVPFRYKVPEVYYDFVKMTVDKVGINHCDCENVLSLDNRNRYQCCLWKGGLTSGVTNPKTSLHRTFSCKAPGTRINPDVPCSHVLRYESQCGDTGGCFCRLEYVSDTPTENREPWDCNGCCRSLTGNFDIDLVDARNNTRFDCLANVFNTAPTRNYCEAKFNFPRLPPAPPSSDASNLRVFLSSISVPFFVFIVIQCWFFKTN